MLCAMTWRRGWAVVLGAALVGPAVMRVTSGEVSAQAARPNIVLMFPDNLGWGEVGAYGSVRGPITPRLDRLASEGIRLNNFNVEFSCTVSRAALMTGRYAIRSGATQPGGITLWEVTIAEALKSIGYATALFGKWHLGGDRARRPPRAVAPGLRRVLRHSAHQQRSAGPPSRRARRRRIRRSSGKARPGSRHGASSRSTRRRAGTIDRESADKRHRVHGEACARRARRSSSTTRSRRFISRRCRIRISPARPAPATSATRWRRWTPTSAACSMRSTA